MWPTWQVNSSKHHTAEQHGQCLSFFLWSLQTQVTEIHHFRPLSSIVERATVPNDWTKLLELSCRLNFCFNFASECPSDDDEFNVLHCKMRVTSCMCYVTHRLHLHDNCRRKSGNNAHSCEVIKFWTFLIGNSVIGTFTYAWRILQPDTGAEIMHTTMEKLGVSDIFDLQKRSKGNICKFTTGLPLRKLPMIILLQLLRTPGLNVYRKGSWNYLLQNDVISLMCSYNNRQLDSIFRTKWI